MGLMLYSRDSVSRIFGHTPTVIHVPSDSLPISDQFFGIELELENVPRDLTNLPQSLRGGWLTKTDGSLRGRAVEIISNGPQCGASLLRHIDELYAFFGLHQISADNNASFRTSTHVHMDFTRESRYTGGMAPDSLHGAQCVVLLYYLLEEQFFNIAGLHRRRSGFSFGYDEAPTELWDFLGPSAQHYVREANRYYGLNFRSLASHGTLEFRHLPLVVDQQVLLKWLRMLCRLKLWAYENMRQDTGRGLDILSDMDALQQANAHIFSEYSLPPLNMDIIAGRVEELSSVLDSINTPGTSGGDLLNSSSDDYQGPLDVDDEDDHDDEEDDYIRPAEVEVAPIRVTLGTTGGGGAVPITPPTTSPTDWLDSALNAGWDTPPTAWPTTEALRAARDTLLRSTVRVNDNPFRSPARRG